MEKISFISTVVKIARAVNIVMESEPNGLYDGDIDYANLSNKTLNVLYKYVAKGIEPPTVKELIPNSIVAGKNVATKITAIQDPFVDHLITLFERHSLCANTDATNGRLVVPVQSNIQNVSIDMDVLFAMFTHFNLNTHDHFEPHPFVLAQGTSNNSNNNDVVVIEMPVIDEQRKESFIFTREAWVKFCAFLVLVITYLHEIMSNTSSFERAEITELFSSDDEEQNVEDAYDGDEDDVSSNDSTDGGSDTSNNQMSPTALDKKLYALYNKN